MFFVPDPAGPGQHPRTQDFTLPMPASRGTIESFWSLPPPAFACVLPAWVLSAGNWPSSP